MTLFDIAPLIKTRQPGVGICHTYKIFYIVYPRLIFLHGKIIPKNKIVKFFSKLLSEYGLDKFNLQEWKLFIDCREDNDEPHTYIPDALLEIEKIFTKENITFVTNALFDRSLLRYNYEYHPTTGCLIGNFYDSLQSQNIQWENIQIQKHFLSLARRPSVKRLIFTKELIDKFGFEHLTVSAGSIIQGKRMGILVNPPNLNFENTDGTKIVKIEDIPNLSWEDYLYPYSYPITLDGLATNETQHKNFNFVFFTNLFKIVLETTENEHQPINLSEKTFKAFAWHTIPIWHAKNGTVHEIKKLGFDLFEDLIDHSYDHATSYENKKNLIFLQLDRLYQAYPSKESLNNLRKKVFERLKYNNDLLAKYVSKEKQIPVLAMGHSVMTNTMSDKIAGTFEKYK